MRRALLAFAVFLAPGAAEAHMRLIDPAPINDNLTNGGSCGGVQGTPTRTQLTAGTQVVIHWIEVQPHNGLFQLSFSPSDRSNFPTILADDIPHPTTQSLPRMFSQTITVPSTPCASCTIRFGLKENGGLNYVSCADVQIVAAPPPVAPDAGFAFDSGSGGMPPQNPTPDAGTMGSNPPPSNPPPSNPPPSNPPPSNPPPSDNPPPSNPPPSDNPPPVSSPPPSGMTPGDPQSPAGMAANPQPAAPEDGIRSGAMTPAELRQVGETKPVEGGCRCLLPDRSGSAFGLILLMGLGAFVSLRSRSKAKNSR